MQHTRNPTMTKTDRDTLRSLHGRKKWEHIWAYYKLPIAIVLIIVYILGYAAYRHVTKKEDVLYLGLVNITAGSDLTEQLTTGFAEAQCLTKKQQVDTFRTAPVAHMRGGNAKFRRWHTLYGGRKKDIRRYVKP